MYFNLIFKKYATIIISFNLIFLLISMLTFCNKSEYKTANCDDATSLCLDITLKSDSPIPLKYNQVELRSVNTSTGTVILKWHYNIDNDSNNLTLDDIPKVLKIAGTEMAVPGQELYLEADLLDTTSANPISFEFVNWILVEVKTPNPWWPDCDDCTEFDISYKWQIDTVNPTTKTYALKSTVTNGLLGQYRELHLEYNVSTGRAEGTLSTKNPEVYMDYAVGIHENDRYLVDAIHEEYTKTIWDGGSENAHDILIVPVGYHDSDLYCDLDGNHFFPTAATIGPNTKTNTNSYAATGCFWDDAIAATNAILDTEPYSSFAHRLTIKAVPVESPIVGIDPHPISDAWTPFQVYIFTENVLNVDPRGKANIESLADQYKVNTIMLLVNNYMQSGDYADVRSVARGLSGDRRGYILLADWQRNSNSSVYVAKHELGHTFGLSDEYCGKTLHYPGNWGNVDPSNDDDLSNTHWSELKGNISNFYLTGIGAYFMRENDSNTLCGHGSDHNVNRLVSQPPASYDYACIMHKSLHDHFCPVCTWLLGARLYWADDTDLNYDQIRFDRQGSDLSLMEHVWEQFIIKYLVGSTLSNQTGGKPKSLCHNWWNGVNTDLPNNNFTGAQYLKNTKFSDANLFIFESANPSEPLTRDVLASNLLIRKQTLIIGEDVNQIEVGSSFLETLVCRGKAKALMRIEADRTEYDTPGLDRTRVGHRYNLPLNFHLLIEDGIIYSDNNMTNVSWIFSTNSGSLHSIDTIISTYAATLASDDSVFCTDYEPSLLIGTIVTNPLLNDRCNFLDTEPDVLVFNINRFCNLGTATTLPNTVCTTQKPVHYNNLSLNTILWPVVSPYSTPTFNTLFDSCHIEFTLHSHSPDFLSLEQEPEVATGGYGGITSGEPINGYWVLQAFDANTNQIYIIYFTRWYH